MQSNHREHGWRDVARSAGKPLHLVLLIVSLLLLLDPPVAIVGLFGLALDGILIWHDLHSPPEDPDEARDEAHAVEIAGEYRRQVDAAEAARRRIHTAVDASDRSLARVISPIKRQADQVVQRVRGLAQRAQRLDGFLARGNREDLEESLAAIDAQIAGSSDEFSREQYRQARTAREAQLLAYDELNLCLQRVRAQITNVLTSLDAAEAKVMMLQAADLRHAGEVGDAVTRSLQALGQEVASFQEGIDATIALRAR